MKAVVQKLAIAQHLLCVDDELYDSVVGVGCRRNEWKRLFVPLLELLLSFIDEPAALKHCLRMEWDCFVSLAMLYVRGITLR